MVRLTQQPDQVRLSSRPPSVTSDKCPVDRASSGNANTGAPGGAEVGVGNGNVEEEETGKELKRQKGMELMRLAISVREKVADGPCGRKTKEEREAQGRPRSSVPSICRHSPRFLSLRVSLLRASHSQPGQVGVSTQH